jgi:hypothetical protein
MHPWSRIDSLSMWCKVDAVSVSVDAADEDAPCFYAIPFVACLLVEWGLFLLVVATCPLPLSAGTFDQVMMENDVQCVPNSRIMACKQLISSNGKQLYVSIWYC